MDMDGSDIFAQAAREYRERRDGKVRPLERRPDFVRLGDYRESPPMSAYEDSAQGAVETVPAIDFAAIDFAATAFVWQDPATLPRRPWLYGRHLLRRQVAVTVAPGGVGKSSLTICEGLAMASGRDLMGEWVARDLRVWLFNLEDPRDELQLRITAAMQHHGVAPDEIAGRLFVDTGRERDLCTAVADRNGTMIVKPVMEAFPKVKADQ